MINRRTFRKFTLYSSAFAVIAMSFSVSLTHIFIFVSSVFFLAGFLAEKLSGNDSVLSSRKTSTDASHAVSSHHKKINFNFIKSPFFAGAGIFFALFVSGLINNGAAEENISWLYKSEFSDAALFLFGLLIYYMSSADSKNRIIYLHSLEIFIVILILSGLISSFSEFRLSNLIMQQNMIPSAANRPQHPLFSVYGLQIFQPVGFMNTRLTYAGLLVMILPYAFSKIFSKRGLLNSGKITSTAVFLTGMWVLFLNNSRSAQMGLVLSAIIALFSPLFFPALFRMRRKILMLVPVLMVAALVSGIYFLRSPEKLTLLENRIIRYTDYQRPIIWKGSREVFLKNPAAGSGPGNFTKATNMFRSEFIREHPEVKYFIENTPSGHAHNDLLHLAATGGIFAGLFYLLLILNTAVFFGNSVKNYDRNFFDDHGHLFLTVGAAALFIAGLAQCYFQDDEVVVVLWSILALLSASEKNDHRILHSDSH